MYIGHVYTMNCVKVEIFGVLHIFKFFRLDLINLIHTWDVVGPYRAAAVFGSIKSAVLQSNEIEDILCPIILIDMILKRILK